MKLQRTFICFAGVFFAVGFAASQAGAGAGPLGCNFDGATVELEIYVKSMQAGSPSKPIQTGPNQTHDVTAKAYILKGTAAPTQILDTTLKIEAVTPVNGTVIGSAETAFEAIRLGVGKAAKGAKLAVPVKSCSGGNLQFVATFTGEDLEHEPCVGTKTIIRPCK